jgi:hypothetical protein
MVSHNLNKCVDYICEEEWRMTRNSFKSAGFRGSFGEGFYSKKPGSKVLAPLVQDNDAVERADET